MVESSVQYLFLNKRKKVDWFNKSGVIGKSKGSFRANYFVQELGIF